MTQEKRIKWVLTKGESDFWDAYNSKNEFLGCLGKERVGRFMHWCWTQDNEIYMSPGCLQEVRDKQKELSKLKLKK